MRSITSVVPGPDFTLRVAFDDGEARSFDLKPWLADEAFEELADPDEFRKVRSQGYFVEWENGADLSADTLYLLGQEEP